MISTASAASARADGSRRGSHHVDYTSAAQIGAFLERPPEITVGEYADDVLRFVEHGCQPYARGTFPASRPSGWLHVRPGAHRRRCA